HLPEFLHSQADRIATPEGLAAAFETLIEEAPLRTLSIGEVIEAIDAVARAWEDPEFPWRKKALRSADRPGGFSRPVLSEALDALFASITKGALIEALEEAFGTLDVFDRFVVRGGGMQRVVPLRGILQIFSGNVPQPAVVSLVRGFLLRAPMLAKPASGDIDFPLCFAASLEEVAPPLGASLIVAHWPGAEGKGWRPLFQVPEAVVVHGSDETLQTLRAFLTPKQTWIGYGHRTSVALIGRERVEGEEGGRVAQALAEDVALLDQRGCLSPRSVYLETSPEGARRFANRLAEALDAIEARLPSPPLLPGEVSGILALRSLAALRGARLWNAERPNWTILLHPTLALEASGLHRVVNLFAVRDLEELSPLFHRHRNRLQGMGLAVAPERQMAIAEAFPFFSRYCPIGRMQRPPFSWPQDRFRSLAKMARWISLEGEGG
ncbi:MAG: hypothetical protein D6812_12970, partial [Deltaproteobacteria bacterium]